MKILRLVFFVVVFFACREEEETLQILPSTEGGTVEIYQLAKVYAKDIPVEDRHFEGTFGTTPISLGRVGEDSLVFLVPRVDEGNFQLKVTTGNQLRTWDLRVINLQVSKDPQVFFESFLKSARALQNRILEVEELKQLSNPFGNWIDFFEEKKRSLSNSEQKEVAEAFQYRKNELFFANPHQSFEVPCFNFPESTVGSMTYRFGTHDLSSLKYYSKLPKNKLNEAIVSGLALSFWYQKLLLELYSQEILDCPILQRNKLKVVDSDKVLQQDDVLMMESKVPMSFIAIGEFKGLTKEDLVKDQGGIYNYESGFREKSSYSAFFSDLIEKYKKDYDWQMPTLNPESLVNPPDQTPIVYGPVKQVSWNRPMVSSPDIKVLNYKMDQGLLTVVLGTEKKEKVPFFLELSFSTGNPLIPEFTQKAVLDPGCAIDLEVILKGKTHVVEVSSELPYQITWSNGQQEVLSQTLPPGEYEVVVRDQDGCERSVKFASPEFGTVTDIDGNVYETVKVGGTWWMTESLRTTRLNTGVAIKDATMASDWISATTPSYTRLPNDTSEDKLYNYFAACCDICPTGWRLPSLQEFGELTRIFGFPGGPFFRNVEGWPVGFAKANNLSGLRFLPGEVRSGSSGNFSPATEVATIWTGYQDRGIPYLGIIFKNWDGISFTLATNVKDGHRIRCVK